MISYHFLTALFAVILGVAVTQTAQSESEDLTVHFQAHRGGLREAPENTLAAYRYAWGLGGIPEVDICTTRDGVIICLHDSTLARTTNAPEDVKDVPVSELTFDEVRKWDAGAWFNARFGGERVPELREVFAEMQGKPERQVYLDFKKLDLKQLSDLIAEYGVAKQIIFCHCVQENCITLQGLSPDVRTMLWIGGEPNEIMAKFEQARATGFKGLNQVQLHLDRKKWGQQPFIASAPSQPQVSNEAINGYCPHLFREFAARALAQAREAGLDLEVLPFTFDAGLLANLLDIGVRWYATDEPKRFMECVKQWQDRMAGVAVSVRAHRGGAEEAPENTLAAFQHAWSLEYTIPEVDVQTTADGVLICLHDKTFARTTNVPESSQSRPAAELPYEEIAKLDAGEKFGKQFAGEKVPRLVDVLDLMRGHPEREIYLDAKGTDFERVKPVLDEYGVLSQVIFCDEAEDGKQIMAGARLFDSIAGEPDEIKARFAELAASGFDGLSHLQIHLKTKQVEPGIVYALGSEFLQDALRQARAACVTLQLRPFRFDAASMAWLLDLGIRDFETDEPARMREYIREWQKNAGLTGERTTVALQSETRDASQGIFFQAHRGGVDEVPENTLAGFRYAWQIKGAVPEVDVQTTKDGVLICLHDDTLARTTNASDDVKRTPVTELTFDVIRRWDAGVRFSEKYAGERVPSLDEVLTLMTEFPNAQLYLDVKGVDFGQLRDMLEKHGVTKRVIFVHGEQATCIQLQEFFQGARTMTWLGGTPEKIKDDFARLTATNFEGISQLQFHLKTTKPEGEIVYVLEPEFLRQAVEKTRGAGVELQLRPFRFDAKSLRELIDLGVHWYVTDAPKAFADTVRAARVAR